MTARGTGGRRGRITGIVVVSALSAGLLAGCGSSPGSSASGSGPLKVWVRGSGDSLKAYDRIFAAFTAKTGVKVQPYMTLTDFETKLSAAASAHDLPDVVVDNASQLGNFESQGII